MPGLLPAVNDALECRIFCQAQAQASLNVLHYVVVGTGGAGLTLAQAAAPMALTFGALYKVWMPPTADFSGITLQNLTFPMSSSVVDTASAGPGTTGTELAPRQVSGLIHLRSELAGPRHRGRKYVGFMSSTYLTATGELSVAGGTALGNVGATFGPIKNTLVGADSLAMRLIVRHPRLAGPPPVEQFTVVTQVLGSNLLATQKRRGDYGRTNVPL